MVNINRESSILWESDNFNNEIRNLSFLDKCDFFCKKAVNESSLLKRGNFINLVSHFGDVWVEIDKASDESDHFSPVECFDKGLLQRKSKIRYIAPQIKNLEYPNNPRIVYTRKGKFGGKDGKPLKDFLNDKDFS